MGFTREAGVSLCVSRCQPRQWAGFVRPALKGEGMRAARSWRCAAEASGSEGRDSSNGLAVGLHGLFLPKGFYDSLPAAAWLRSLCCRATPGVNGRPSLLQSMFAVGWLELQEVQKAQSQLDKCFSNITEPFKVSHVPRHGGCPGTSARCFYHACSPGGRTAGTGAPAAHTCGPSVRVLLCWVPACSVSSPRASKEQQGGVHFLPGIPKPWVGIVLAPGFLLPARAGMGNGDGGI